MTHREKTAKIYQRWHLIKINYHHGKACGIEIYVSKVALLWSDRYRLHGNSPHTGEQPLPPFTTTKAIVMLLAWAKVHEPEHNGGHSPWCMKSSGKWTGDDCMTRRNGWRLLECWLRNKVYRRATFHIILMAWGAIEAEHWPDVLGIISHWKRASTCGDYFPYWQYAWTALTSSRQLMKNRRPAISPRHINEWCRTGQPRGYLLGAILVK